MEEEIVGSEGWVVPRSDEAQYSFFQWVNYLQIKTGSYSSGTVNGTGGDLVTADAAYYNFWRKNYVAINQCSTFLKYVDLNKGESPDKIKAMKAEARFLRAFYYFCLFRQFGPVYIWGDQMPGRNYHGFDDRPHDGGPEYRFHRRRVGRNQERPAAADVRYRRTGGKFCRTRYAGSCTGPESTRPAPSPHRRSTTAATSMSAR